MSCCCRRMGARSRPLATHIKFGPFFFSFYSCVCARAFGFISREWEKGSHIYYGNDIKLHFKNSIVKWVPSIIISDRRVENRTIFFEKWQENTIKISLATIRKKNCSSLIKICCEAIELCTAGFLSRWWNLKLGMYAHNFCSMFRSFIYIRWGNCESNASTQTPSKRFVHWTQKKYLTSISFESSRSFQQKPVLIHFDRINITLHIGNFTL